MIDQALQLLKSHNYKITKQRRTMLEYLSGFRENYVNVTKIDEHMRELFPGISHDTVYRNIREFAEIGIFETKSRPNGTCVKYQCDFNQMHHHHFVCRKCGRVQEIKICPLDFQKQLPGCVIEDHRFELTGLCSECAETERNF